MNKNLKSNINIDLNQYPIEIVLLSRIFENNEIDKYTYGIYCKKDEAVCLLLNDDKWEVFSYERGSKQEVRIFFDVNDACIYFIERVLYGKLKKKILLEYNKLVNEFSNQENNIEKTDKKLLCLNSNPRKKN